MKKLVSYKHEKAIEVLKSWFEDSYFVELDWRFYIDEKIIFVPDLTISQDGIIQGFYEVVNKHGLTGKKYGIIQSWCYRNYDVPVYEVNADWILSQVEKPHVILADRFYTETKDYENEAPY